MKKVKLGDICEVFSGFAFKAFNEDKQGKPVIKIGNIQADGEISIEECVYTKETPQEKYFSQINDIYIALSGATTGKVGIMKREGFLINQRVGVVRLKNENVPINYLFSFLKSKTVTILHDAFGAAQPNISPKDLLNYEINIDKYVSMKAIAEKLDKVSGLIEKRKAQIEKLDLLIKSRFIEMFGDLILNPYGWKIVNITEVISGKVTNGFFAKRDEYIDNGNVSILGVANIINRMYSNVEDLPRTNGTPSDIQKFEVRYGDMLFCRSSLVAEGIGKASIVPQDVPPNTLFECHVIRLPLDLDKCVPEFMQVLSTTDYFRSQVISQSKTATMTTIGQDGILKTMIILPPIENQKQFLEFVKQTNKSKLEIQKSLEKLETLKKSLMQQYFG